MREALDRSAETIINLTERVKDLQRINKEKDELIEHFMVTHKGQEAMNRKLYKELEKQNNANMMLMTQNAELKKRLFGG